MQSPKHHKALLSAIAHHDDKKAFEELFEYYYQHLYAVAFHFTRCKEPAEEIVADVFYKIWKKRKTLNTIQNIHTYLYTAVKNQALNYLYKEKNHLYSVDNYTENFSSHTTPERILILDELQQEITEALAQLPPQCQLIFKLIREDGLKYKEAAEILGISQKTIEVQIGIALKKLSHILKKHLPHRKAKTRITKIEITSLIGYLLLFWA